MSFQELEDHGLSIRIDDTTTPNVTYFGWAPMGSLENEEKWRIMKMDETTGVSKVLWADGDDQFNNVWNNRATTVVYK